MQPGYVKKTKTIKSNTRSGGYFVNMNQVVLKIKEMANVEKFYEIEPATVLKVHLDPNDPEFPTVSGTDLPDLNYLGSVVVNLLETQKDKDSAFGVSPSKPIRCISQHIVQYPVKGEVVNVTNHDGYLYYSNPLNLDGRVSMNRKVGATGDGILQKDALLPSLLKNSRKVLPDNGDTVIQGRFGQSIQFGSDRDYINPNVKITVGQSKSQFDRGYRAKFKNQYMPHINNINFDQASIYISTNEHIPLKTAAPSQMKPLYLGGKKRSVIAMNADNIALNAKRGGDLSAFASRHLTLAARTSINLESEFGEINLGDVDSINPVVKGKQLEEFLNDFIGIFRAYTSDVSSFLKSKESRSDKEDEGNKKQINDFTKNSNDKLNKLIMRLGENADFFSNRVFVAENYIPTSFGVQMSNWENEEWEYKWEINKATRTDARGN